MKYYLQDIFEEFLQQNGFPFINPNTVAGAAHPKWERHGYQHMYDALVAGYGAGVAEEMQENEGHV